MTEMMSQEPEGNLPPDHMSQAPTEAHGGETWLEAVRDCVANAPAGPGAVAYAVAAPSPVGGGSCCLPPRPSLLLLFSRE